MMCIVTKRLVGPITPPLPRSLPPPPFNQKQLFKKKIQFLLNIDLRIFKFYIWTLGYLPTNSLTPFLFNYFLPSRVHKTCCSKREYRCRGVGEMEAKEEGGGRAWEEKEGVRWGHMKGEVYYIKISPASPLLILASKKWPTFFLIIINITSFLI